jgi:hypothetical protein
MKKLLLLIAACAIGFSLQSCGEATRTRVSTYSDVENAVAKFNDGFAKAHPELSQADRKLLSQYVLSHVMRGEKLSRDLVIADAISEQKSINSAASQIQ